MKNIQGIEHLVNQLEVVDPIQRLYQYESDKYVAHIKKLKTPNYHSEDGFEFSYEMVMAYDKKTDTHMLNFSNGWSKEIGNSWFVTLENGDNLNRKQPQAGEVPQLCHDIIDEMKATKKTPETKKIGEPDMILNNMFQWCDFIGGNDIEFRFDVLKKSVVIGPFTFKRLVCSDGSFEMKFDGYDLTNYRQPSFPRKIGLECVSDLDFEVIRSLYVKACKEFDRTDILASSGCIPHMEYYTAVRDGKIKLHKKTEEENEVHLRMLAAVNPEKYALKKSA